MSIPPDQRDDEQASASPQTAGIEETPDAPESRRPWFTSTWVFIGCSGILIVIFCMIGFLSYSDTFLDYVRKPFERPASPLAATRTAPALPSLAPGPLPSPTIALANTQAACIILWVEHAEDDLGRKSRARVYEELVSEQVKEAGMTPRKFYDLVVEHNPQLVEDDYEFKKGKIYLLPECQ